MSCSINSAKFKSIYGIIISITKGFGMLISGRGRWVGEWVGWLFGWMGGMSEWGGWGGQRQMKALSEYLKGFGGNRLRLESLLQRTCQRGLEGRV
jgi:hypothetical protein